HRQNGERRTRALTRPGPTPLSGVASPPAVPGHSRLPRLSGRVIALHEGPVLIDDFPSDFNEIFPQRLQDKGSAVPLVSEDESGSFLEAHRRDHVPRQGDDETVSRPKQFAEFHAHPSERAPASSQTIYQEKINAKFRLYLPFAR